MLTQFFADIEGIQTRAGGDIKITISTQILKPEEMTKLFELREKQVYMAVMEFDKENPDRQIELADIEVPEQEPEFKNQKSPSERLRNVLYVLWKQDGVKTDFETWRIGQMEKIIEHYKTKLKPE